MTTTTAFDEGRLIRQGLSQAAKGAWQGILAEWQLWVVVALVLLLVAALKLWDFRRLARSGIEFVDRMDGRRFEEYLGVLFRRLGYSAEVTPYVGDYGADVIVSRNGVRSVVQAKHRSRGTIGPKAVQEATTARRYYGAQRAVVVTNRSFTRAAQRLARANEVDLWGRDELVRKLTSVRRVPVSPGSPFPSMGTWMQSEPSIPSGFEPGSVARCAKCGAVVSAKVRAFCVERPERFGGLVYCYNHQREVR